MAQFPVSDDQNLQDAVNQLLSGPAGLGQNFQGFSSYTPAFLTGNYRPPFTYPTSANMYVAPITLSTSEQLDARTYKYTFASTQASIPFVPGMGPYVSGVDVDWYNGSYTSPGVVECTTDYVIIVGSSDHLPLEPNGSGGTIEYYSTINGEDPTDYYYCSTDCNAKVTVTGASDRVFVAGQLDNIISFETNIAANFDYTVFINRYKGTLTDDPTNPDYRFSLDEVVSKKTYHYFGLETYNSPLDSVTTIFTSIIDRPGPGYYWYILDVAFNGLPFDGGSVPNFQVTTSEFSVRSLSAQVVKE